jgi:hypothetical protein
VSKKWKKSGKMCQKSVKMCQIVECQKYVKKVSKKWNQKSVKVCKKNVKKMLKKCQKDVKFPEKLTKS